MQIKQLHHGCQITASMTTNTTVQDQKKRTLEALERRFALAEAEIRQQQENSKKRPREEKNRVTQEINSSSSDASVTPSNTLSKRDVEVNDPTYFRLSHPVHENLLTSVKISNGRETVVDKVSHELLRNGDVAQKYMQQGSKSMKIGNWILLDNFLQKSGTTGGVRNRASQGQSKRSKKHMSLKQLKKCGSFNLPQELHKFEIFKPMHEMWKDYISRLIKNVGKNQLAQCLLSADLHGAVIIVAHCKIAAFTGLNGIMIRETAETFGIITQDDKFQVVPKKVCVFMLQVDCWKITLHGDKFTSRNLVP